MKVDMHVHTYRCGHSTLTPQLIVKLAKRKKLDAVAVTDHHSVKPALEVTKYARKSGIKIITGAEYSTNFGHIVCYNIREDVNEKNFWDVYDFVKEHGGKISIPHAFDFFRRGSFINQCPANERKRIFKKVDFIEINGRSFFFSNVFAKKIARLFRKKLIAGSDAHLPVEVGRFYTDIDSKFKPESIHYNEFNLFLPMPLLLMSFLKKAKTRIIKK